MRGLISSCQTVVIILLILALPVVSIAQNRDSTRKAEKQAKEAEKQAKEEEKSNILVVPFEPQMYNVSGDQYICMKSKMTPGELSDMIRRSLTTTLIYNMSDIYNVEEPPNDLTHKNMVKQYR